MAQYQKKPVVIDAHRWTGRNHQELVDWARSLPGGTAPFNFVGDDLFVYTFEGEMKATIGDMIIRGIKGEFYPCKPDIFEATYDVFKPEPAKLWADWNVSRD